MVEIDVKDLDRVVFKDNHKKDMVYKEYQEEDSYLNPSNSSMYGTVDYDNSRVHSGSQSTLKKGQIQ